MAEFVLELAKVVIGLGGWSGVAVAQWVPGWLVVDDGIGDSPVAVKGGVACLALELGHPCGCGDQGLVGDWHLVEVVDIDGGEPDLAGAHGARKALHNVIVVLVQHVLVVDLGDDHALLDAGRVAHTAFVDMGNPAAQPHGGRGDVKAKFLSRAPAELDVRQLSLELVAEVIGVCHVGVRNAGRRSRGPRLSPGLVVARWLRRWHQCAARLHVAERGERLRGERFPQELDIDIIWRV